jgi:hypothetical protein
MSFYKCPFCNDDPYGRRRRDARGDVWHHGGAAGTVPCYERTRATGQEIAEKLADVAAADRYAGRMTDE